MDIWEAERQVETMPLNVPVAVLAPGDRGVESLATAINGASEGLLWVRGALPELPAVQIQSIMTFFATDEGRNLGLRLNEAYTKNLVFKDSFGDGKGGSCVDRKRVLDLSPERLEAIAAADPSLMSALQDHTGLETVLKFWEADAQASLTVLAALAQATGSEDVLRDAAFNFRMVDYYAFASQADAVPVAPRCGEHRDFGSFTLIHGCHQPGLQVKSQATGAWTDVPCAPSPDHSLLLFGWCTQIRSNGRIPAALHRVVDGPEADGCTARRITGVLFCAPKLPDTALEPVVREGEHRMYISGVKVGQLRGAMARKWRIREGTARDGETFAEESEIRAQPQLKTQDDVVQSMFIAVA